ncbi:DUF2207 domain-containing protein [Microbacterium sp. BK668]|uniref:DUF2207 domain-containing protein n=1 Tax=Microbacterium sp. BK668 TaxID=2512118 RepID=UPI00105EF2AB|nr:DUF2207 domain-containing protein [Microbacterium sp. BK668]TDN91769.1 putative membrane protein DUF2207 [Microbacterium sp. BK668]
MGSLLRHAAAATVAAMVLALAACTGLSVTFGDDTADAPVSTNLDDFSFTSLDVDYTLGRADDGTSRLEVVERFVAEFPAYDQNRGMRRTIPDSYQGVPLHPELVSITDGEGAPRPAEVDHEDGAYSMTSRADDFVHGAQTYVFTYTLENVVGSFADTQADEFYWDVNGVDWAQPFGRISATLHLDAALAAQLTGGLACYHGFQGAIDTCPIGATAGTDASTRIVAETGDVQPYETMTIAVGFTPGTFTPFDTRYLSSPWGWLQALAALGVLAGVVWAAVTRRHRLRDEPGRPTIIAEYTPPPRIDALESAVLLGRTSKAIPAEVLEQAVVGSIRILEGKRRWFGGARLKAQLVDPARADGDGRMLLDGLFPGLPVGAEYEFGQSDKSFSAAAQRILKAANSELARRGLRRKVPARIRAWPIIVTTLAGALVFLLGMAALDAAVDPLVPILLIVGAFAAEFVVIALLAHKPLTALGAEVRDHLAGLKVFIEWAEADRIRMLQSPQGAERVRIDTTSPREMLKLYETLLPYAVVFGQEKQWAEELAVLYGEGNAPGWYSGSSGFNVAAFSAGIGSLSTSASASSSSGGSSGGGSAGGGGGGGGGGGV